MFYTRCQECNGRSWLLKWLDHPTVSQELTLYKNADHCKFAIWTLFLNAMILRNESAKNCQTLWTQGIHIALSFKYKKTEKFFWHMGVWPSSTAKVINDSQITIFSLSFFCPWNIIVKLSTDVQDSHDVRARINTKRTKISPAKIFFLNSKVNVILPKWAFLLFTWFKIDLAWVFLAFFWPRAVSLVFLWRVDQDKVVPASFSGARPDLSSIISLDGKFGCSAFFIRGGF